MKIRMTQTANGFKKGDRLEAAYGTGQWEGFYRILKFASGAPVPRGTYVSPNFARITYAVSLNDA